MWNAAFESLKMDSTYEVFDVTPEELDDKFIALKKDFAGFSVSIPHKETIIPHLDGISNDAQEIGAVNTVSVSGGLTYGDNTDWIGATKALSVIPDLNTKRILINGSGGTARAIIFALNRLGSITHVYGRNNEKVQRIADEFQAEITESLTLENIDVFINATPIGLDKDEKYPVDLPETVEWIFDAVYGKTELVQRAESLGIKTIDGREMLLYQGIAQFELLTDEIASVEVMRTAIYA